MRKAVATAEPPREKFDVRAVPQLASALSGIPERYWGKIVTTAVEIVRGKGKNDINACAHQLWQTARYITDDHGDELETVLRQRSLSGIFPGALWPRDVCRALLEGGDLIVTLKAQRDALSRMIDGLEKAGL